MRKLLSIAGIGAILFGSAFLVVERAKPQSGPNACAGQFDYEDLFLSFFDLRADSTCSTTVIWSLPSVYAGLSSGTSVNTEVAFTSNQALQSAVVEADPQISGFVRIQPSTFAQVAAGQPQTVHLTFSAAAGAQYAAYDGTIHVRTGTSTLNQMLPTSVTYAVVVLPPDPGDAGKATLAGVDADVDGVRDDVERWIALAFPSSAKTRAALTQETRALQTAVLSSKNQTQAVTALNAEIAGYTCLAGLLQDSLQAGSMSDQLDTVVLNTPSRMQAYLTANSSMSGSAFGLPSIASRTSFCAFNPNALPN